MISRVQRAVPALVGKLPKGKPQVCPVSKASTVDMVKHNKQAASFHSVRKTGRTEQNARTKASDC